MHRLNAALIALVIAFAGCTTSTTFSVETADQKTGSWIQLDETFDMSFEWIDHDGGDGSGFSGNGQGISTRVVMESGIETPNGTGFIVKDEIFADVEFTHDGETESETFEDTSISIQRSKDQLYLASAWGIIEGCNPGKVAAFAVPGRSLICMHDILFGMHGDVPESILEFPLEHGNSWNVTLFDDVYTFTVGKQSTMETVNGDKLEVIEISWTVEMPNEEEAYRLEADVDEVERVAALDASIYYAPELGLMAAQEVSSSEHVKYYKANQLVHEQKSIYNFTTTLRDFGFGMEIDWQATIDATDLEVIDVEFYDPGAGSVPDLQVAEVQLSESKVMVGTELTAQFIGEDIVDGAYEWELIEAINGDIVDTGTDEVFTISPDVPGNYFVTGTVNFEADEQSITTSHTATLLVYDAAEITAACQTANPVQPADDSTCDSITLKLGPGVYEITGKATAPSTQQNLPCAELRLSYNDETIVASSGWRASPEFLFPLLVEEGSTVTLSWVPGVSLDGDTVDLELIASPVWQTLESYVAPQPCSAT